MKTLLILSTLLSSVFATKAERFSLTPTPIQSAFPSGCTDFAQAVPGDTCESFARKHHLSYFQFLAFNPQIGGPFGCPQNLYGWHWYCVGPNDGRPTATGKPMGVAATPPRTTLMTSTVAPAPTSTTTTPPPQATTVPPAVTCAINDCWRAYARAMSGARSSQSSWCTTVLHNDPPITESRINYFPGIPVLVAAQCTGVATSAAPVLSSYCSCFTQGQMDYTRSI